MKNPERTWVLIPFEANADRSSHKEWKDNWRDRLGREDKILNLTSVYKLAGVENGDTIYIQGHGFTNDLSQVGASKSSMDADLLAKTIATNIGSPRTNLRIKVFSCFSGFKFASQLYNALRGSFPGLRVYGYTGMTQVTARESKKLVTRIPEAYRKEGTTLGNDVHAVQNREVDLDTVRGKDAQVVYGAPV